MHVKAPYTFQINKIMEFVLAVIVMLSLISKENVACNRVQKRLKVLENRVDTLETRVNMEKSNTEDGLLDVYGRVMDINETVKQLEAVCQNENRHADIIQPTENKHIIPPATVVDIHTRIMAAFKYEKVNIRKTMDQIEMKLDEIDQNGGTYKNAELDIQAFVEEYVANITTALAEIEDELSDRLQSTVTEIKQYVDKQNTDLSSAKLNELVIRMSQLEKTQTTAEKKYHEMKHDFKDLRATIANKFKRLYECQDQWSRYDLFCYQFFNVKVVYHEAQKVCAGVGASVVDFQSRAELEFVVDLVGSANYWIGLTDIVRESTWIWDRTKSKTSFLNWRPGQPDSRYGNNQDCVIAGWQVPRDKWNDQGCTHKHAFVCKKHL